MDGLVLQNKIYKRYAFAAKRIGVDFQLHRPISAISAIPHQISTIKASFNAKDFGYSKPNEYGKPAWYGIFDGRLTQPGDYLIASGQPTYFIAAMQLNIPIYCIECNVTISLSKRTATSAVGNIGYSGSCGGSSNDTDTVIMSGWPASCLIDSKGIIGLNLPASGKDGRWKILFPKFCNIIIQSGFIIKDDINRRYVVDSAEDTDMGWRILATELHP